jgi:hypothetical protein
MAKNVFYTCQNIDYILQSTPRKMPGSRRRFQAKGTIWLFNDPHTNVVALEDTKLYYKRESEADYAFIITAKNYLNKNTP